MKRWKRFYYQTMPWLLGLQVIVVPLALDGWKLLVAIPCLATTIVFYTLDHWRAGAPKQGGKGVNREKFPLIQITDVEWDELVKKGEVQEILARCPPGISGSFLEFRIKPEGDAQVVEDAPPHLPAPEQGKG